MVHLIKLELKKFGIGRNIIFTFAAILFSILFITISLWDSVTDPEQTKDTFESTYLVIGLLMSFIFLVYSSVLTARLVIGEYNQGTIIIMFSYPFEPDKIDDWQIGDHYGLYSNFNGNRIHLLQRLYCVGGSILGYVGGDISSLNASYMDTNGNHCCDCMHSIIAMAVHYWHDPKICSCNNRYFPDCYCVSASYNQQKCNLSRVPTANCFNCYRYSCSHFGYLQKKVPELY